MEGIIMDGSVNPAPTDWLKEFQHTLTACIGIAVVGSLIGIAVTGAGSVTATLPADDVFSARTRPTGIDNAASLDTSGTIDLVVKEPSLQQICLSVLTWLPTVGLILVMLVSLWRSVKAARGNAFTLDLSGRLRRLGLITIVGGCVAWAVAAVATFVLAGTVTGHPAAALTMNAPLTLAVVGIGYFAIAEIIKRGAAMRAELDEVI